MNLNRRLIQLALCATVLLATALTGTATAYVNGHDALKDKPFVAGLRKPGNTKFFCTATLLHKDWVLTAAHCLKGKTVADVQVVVGDTNLNDTTDPAEIHAPDALHLNPKWKKTANAGDVALIHLATPSNIEPVRLGVTPALTEGMKRCQRLVNLATGMMRDMIEQSCTSGRGKALGWGRRSMSAAGTSDTLREVTPTIFGSPRNTYWRVKSGACPGDSGGPLLALKADGSPRQIGLASYNKHGNGTWDFLVGDQCSTKSYDFYSDVSSGDNRKWIESITRIRDHRP